jgi:hypothetical protein
MGPARFHCATLLQVQDHRKLEVTTKPTKRIFVRSGIRTHAHRSGLRPERSALDLSAILTACELQGPLAEFFRASC